MSNSHLVWSPLMKGPPISFDDKMLQTVFGPELFIDKTVLKESNFVI